MIKEDGVKLTDRQKQVAILVAHGKSSKEIAQELGVTEKTVGAHRNNIRIVLRIKNRVELVKYVIRMGWVSIRD